MRGSLEVRCSQLMLAVVQKRCAAAGVPVMAVACSIGQCRFIIGLNTCSGSTWMSGKMMFRVWKSLPPEGL